MGFFLGKRTGNGWHVGYGSNGMHVGKSTPGGWYFGWSGGGKRAKGAPLTARERAVVAGFILLAAALVWWGLERLGGAGQGRSAGAGTGEADGGADRADQ